MKFSANVPLATEDSGNNRVDISAINGANTQTTLSKSAPITGPGSSTSLTYDADGNMTSDGTNSYSWDVEDRLLQITYPGSGNSSQFVYDGLGRCVKIVESGSISDTKQFVWCGDSRCEQRDSSNALKTEFFSYGQRNNIDTSPTNYLYTTDHLGSIREMVNTSGVIQSQYQYDPYGRVTKIAGAGPDSDFQYAGYYVHGRSGLNLTRTRAYSASLARFISRDPIQEAGGINLYDYAANNPVNLLDPSGLLCRPYPPGHPCSLNPQLCGLQGPPAPGQPSVPPGTPRIWPPGTLPPFFPPPTFGAPPLWTPPPYWGTPTWAPPPYTPGINWPPPVLYTPEAATPDAHCSRCVGAPVTADPNTGKAVAPDPVGADPNRMGVPNGPMGTMF